MLEVLCAASIFSGRTWSRARYYGDAFARLAVDIALEFRVRKSFNPHSPSYVFALWWAMEVWDADLGERRTRHAVCLENLRALSLDSIVPSSRPVSISNFGASHISSREHSWRIEFARPYVLRKALYASLYAFIHAAQGTFITAYR